MLTRFELFLEDLALQSINEAKVILDSDLEYLLMSLNSPISRDLLALNSNEIKQDITILKAGQSGFFDFLNTKMLRKSIASAYTHFPVDRIDTFVDFQMDLLNTRNFASDFKNRVDSYQSVRMGKLINTLFPGKYSSQDVENFVNQMRLALEKDIELELVSGADIAFWYDSHNYYALDKGTLASSCMREVDPEFFDIYVRNPEVCKMLILKADDKLKARALVWRVEDQPFEWFMDRRYTNFDYDFKKFEDYASQKGWAYRAKNSADDFKSVYYKGEVSEPELKVKIKNLDYQGFPYMDTFKIYFYKKGLLVNRGSDWVKNDFYVYELESTDGDYSNDLSEVYSDYVGDYIYRGDAVFSDGLSTWIPRSVAIEIKRGQNIGWWPKDHFEIQLIKNSKGEMEYWHTDGLVHSEIMSKYIILEEAKKIVSGFIVRGPGQRTYAFKPHTDFVDEGFTDTINSESFKHMNWFKLLCDNITSDLEDWLNPHGSLFSRKVQSRLSEVSTIWTGCMRKNSFGDFIPKDIAVEVYLSDKDVWLTEQDATNFKIKIDKEKSRIIDYVDYYTDLYLADFFEKYDLMDKLIWTLRKKNNHTNWFFRGGKNYLSKSPIKIEPKY